MIIEHIDTPQALIDLDILERNIRNMAELSHECGVNLRPHTKTHKIPEIVELQKNAGASGITVAKLDEACIMAENGFNDILIANEIIGIYKINRLLTLLERASVRVIVDSVEGAEMLSSASLHRGLSIDVLIDINTGQNRTGVLPGEDALTFARSIMKFKGIKIIGLLTHAGHVYHAKNRKEVEKIGRMEGEKLVYTKELFQREDICIEVISVGSTPTVPYSARVEGVTEIKPGNYVFHDWTQVILGSAGIEDCALTVLTTIISTPAADRAVIDAGAKALAMDLTGHDSPEACGYGHIVERDGIISKLSEEHGVIQVFNDRFYIGEKVRIIPNHACPVSNLFDRMAGVRKGKLERWFTVAARGGVH